MARRMACKKCGEVIDPSLHDQEYTILTVVSDAEGFGVTKERSFLCDDCTRNLELFFFVPEVLL